MCTGSGVDAPQAVRRGLEYSDVDEEVVAPTSSGGGGSTIIVNSITESSVRAINITNSSATINWRTPHFASSKVIFSSEYGGHKLHTANFLNYGYTYFIDNEDKASAHTIELTELEPGTTYYYRCVSAYFPEVISKEHSFTTKGKKVKVLGIEYTYTDDIDNLYGLDKETVELISLQESENIYSHDEKIILTEESQAIFDKLIGDYELSDENKNRIAYFIQVGTKTTKRLGAGERAGVINSFFSAFGIFPESVADWQDIIKIANGRWPGKINAEAKINALKKFIKVYAREADENNQHDNAATTIMAYGLRPANRNLDSEKFAIKIFKNIFKYNPESSTDWDLVRAIAYSGSKR